MPLIDPPADHWARSMRRAAATPRVTRFRAQLGLPHGPLVLAGHQATFWHPGILAKWLAACAAADSLPATWAWLVVDHDTNDPWRIRLPWKDSAGNLSVKVWSLQSAGMTGESLPTVLRPVLAAVYPPVSGLGEEPALPCVGDGVEAIVAALRNHADASSAAAQVTLATRQLLHPLGEPAATVMSSAISRTDLFAELIARAMADPDRCALSYNAAVAAHPRARVRPLQRDSSRGWELPWWSAIAPRRTPAFAADLSRTEPSGLAPRALLMSGLLRLAGCDLFVHGLGGGRYDAITERWFADWLGESLVPVAVVSATCPLAFEYSSVPDPAQIAAIRHMAHTARHDPALLGDTQAAGRKAALLAEIRDQKRRGGRPADAFRAMHAILEECRARHSGELESLRRQAAAAAQRLTEAAIVHDRTWAFPLHPPAALVKLKAQITAQFKR